MYRLKISIKEKLQDIHSLVGKCKDTLEIEPEIGRQEQYRLLASMRTVLETLNGIIEKHE